jgi:hypothetical protein
LRTRIDKSATILAGGLMREILYDRRNQDNTVETGMGTAKSDSLHIPDEADQRSGVMSITIPG